MLVIVGLGNPEKRYENTRHNLGYMIIDRLEEELNIPLSINSFESLWGAGEFNGQGIVLVKPLTYVNASGRAVRNILKHFQLSEENLLVICDDLDLPLGKIRLRKKGGSGGHNGLNSIIEKLGTENFCRLRIGIGRPRGKQSPANFVLSPFTRREWAKIEFILNQAVEVIKLIVGDGFEKAISQSFSSNPKL